MAQGSSVSAAHSLCFERLRLFPQHVHHLPAAAAQTETLLQALSCVVAERILSFRLKPSPLCQDGLPPPTHTHRARSIQTSFPALT